MGKDTDLDKVSLCLSRRDASSYCVMTHSGQSGTSRDVYIRSNFQIDLSGPACASFDAPWWEEHNGVLNFQFQVNVVCKKMDFFLKWPFFIKRHLKNKPMTLIPLKKLQRHCIDYLFFFRLWFSLNRSQSIADFFKQSPLGEYWICSGPCFLT